MRPPLLETASPSGSPGRDRLTRAADDHATPGVALRLRAEAGEAPRTGPSPMCRKVCAETGSHRRGRGEAVRLLLGSRTAGFWMVDGPVRGPMGYRRMGNRLTSAVRA